MQYVPFYNATRYLFYGDVTPKKNIIDNETTFKIETTLDHRKLLSAKIQNTEKTKDRIPVIISYTDDITLSKYKYLCPPDMDLSGVIKNIRQHSSIDHMQTIYVLIHNKMMSTNRSILNIYDNHRDEDGFLYITVATDNSFGSL
jgi:GABA(A) receptor-associated protein